MHALVVQPASSLAALLVLLALASECPHLLLLRPVGPAEDLKALKALARECQARSNRALAVALSATLKNLPRAALVNSRTLIANAADFQESCDHFERSIRDAMAGRKEPDEWEEEGLEDARKKDPGAWISWLRRQKLQRLLRHDGSSLHVDSTSHRPGVLKVQSFRLVGRPNGQDELVT
ncbi:unnamed protein product [Effrenium voratum]|nr:unnamed protein product [Effrenium voratum]